MGYWRSSVWSSTNTRYRPVSTSVHLLQSTCTYIVHSHLELYGGHQVLPPDVLASESGELTELGRSYVPPRVLLDALCTICCSASQWGDPNEAENLAMETVIVSHHPSIGMEQKLRVAKICTWVNFSYFEIMSRSKRFSSFYYYLTRLLFD